MLRGSRRAGLKHLWDTDNYRYVPVRPDSYRDRRWVQSLDRNIGALLFNGDHQKIKTDEIQNFTNLLLFW